MNSVQRIIESCNSNKKEKYNILTFPTHERYETQLCKTGHNFYSFSMDNNKTWNKEQVAVPDNYYILPKNQVPHWINYDFMLVQSKYWQYQVAMDILKQFPMKLIVLEHTLPTPQTIRPEHIEQMKNMLGHQNVFISNFSKNEWDVMTNSKVIHHGLDTNVFCQKEVEKQDHVLTVANKFKERDYCLNYSGWERVTQGLDTRLVGEGNGEGTKNCKDVNELVEEYNKCSVYLNTTTLSPIPMSLLEAMSCGCAVVSTATCMIPEVIDNGKNGYISNDEEELKMYVQTLLKDQELRKNLGLNARNTIKELFSEEKFVKNWNETFDEIYEAK